MEREDGGGGGLELAWFIKISFETFWNSVDSLFDKVRCQI